MKHLHRAQTDSMYPEHLDGKLLQLIQTGNKFHWRWGDWVSAGYDLLEHRPWTPISVNGRLCFTAQEQNQWLVVWGEQRGKLYDDVFELAVLNQLPVYVARESLNWLIVIGTTESQPYPFQVTFAIESQKVKIIRFARNRDVLDVLDPL